MKVTSVMSKYLVRLSHRMTTEEAFERLEAEAVHHALVTHENEIVGVICCCDLDRVPPSTLVGHCMRRDYIFVDEATTAREAAQMMLRWGIGFLPVVGESGEVSGVVTRRDLRRTGFLPNRRGVDRCASCGETHSLLPSTDDWLPVFCRTCAEPPPSPEGPYVTLGGGD